MTEERTPLPWVAELKRILDARWHVERDEDGDEVDPDCDHDAGTCRRCGSQTGCEGDHSGQCPHGCPDCQYPHRCPECGHDQDDCGHEYVCDDCESDYDP